VLFSPGERLKAPISTARNGVVTLCGYVYDEREVIARWMMPEVRPETPFTIARLENLTDLFPIIQAENLD
jgi:hypothetical protein